MDEAELQAAAERNFEASLAASGLLDPRAGYRALLKELRAEDEPLYESLVEYYRTQVLPPIAAGGGDPIGTWLDYGIRIAGGSGAGEVVRIDGTGRSAPFAPPVAPGELLLYLPADSRRRATPLGVPGELSPAQRRTLELLVEGKLRLPQGD